MPQASETLLLTLTGADRPGVTATLMACLADHDVVVVDLEQVVVRGLLVLGVLLAGPGRRAAGVAAEATARDLGMTAVASPGAAEEDPRRRGRVAVTVLGAPLLPSAVGAIAAEVAAAGANIDRIVRLASTPVTCVELEVSGADPAALRVALGARAAAEGVDVAVQPAGLTRRSRRLVVLDVDSTLIRDEVIDLLAEEAGQGPAVRALTEAAMRGEVAFGTALADRVALLAGLEEVALDRVRARVRLAPGARTLLATLRRLGYQVGVVSGGFTAVTDALAADLGLDFAAANVLEVADGRLTGRLVGPVVDRAGKAAALREFAARAGVPLDQTVAIGDGANDLDMLAAAGLGVAFNAKPAVARAADAALSVPYLDAVLYLLGVTGEEAAEAARTPRG